MDLAAGENFVCCLILVVVFIGLGGACEWVGEILKLSYGEQATKG